MSRFKSPVLIVLLKLLLEKDSFYEFSGRNFPRQKGRMQSISAFFLFFFYKGESSWWDVNLCLLAFVVRKWDFEGMFHLIILSHILGCIFGLPKEEVCSASPYKLSSEKDNEENTGKHCNAEGRQKGWQVLIAALPWITCHHFAGLMPATHKMAEYLVGILKAKSFTQSIDRASGKINWLQLVGWLAIDWSWRPGLLFVIKVINIRVVRCRQGDCVVVVLSENRENNTRIRLVSPKWSVASPERQRERAERDRKRELRETGRESRESSERQRDRESWERQEERA